jgi:hypothetical protein
VFSLAGTLRRTVSPSFADGLVRGVPVPWYSNRKAGTAFGTSRFFQSFQVQLPETAFSGLVFGTGHLHEALVQRKVVSDGVLKGELLRCRR